MPNEQIPGENDGQNLREDPPKENKKIHIEDTSFTPPTPIETVTQEDFEVGPEVTVKKPRENVSLSVLVEKQKTGEDPVFEVDPEEDVQEVPEDNYGTGALDGSDTVSMEDISQDVTLKNAINISANISDDEFAIDLPPKINPSSPNDITEPTEDDVRWDAVRVNGYQISSFDDRFVEALSHGSWKQHADFGKVKAKIKRGVMTLDADRELDASNVVNMLKSYIGDGNIVQVPLLNSGFYVAIKPPSEKENIIFLTTIVNDKVELGRETYGAVYSADTGVYEKRVFNFILAHIHSHSIKGSNINIRSLIKASDLNMLKWGLMCAMYPKGHQYSRACDWMPNKCRHVKEGTLDLFSMLMIKDECFTDTQRAHMSNFKTGSMALKDVKEYQSATKGMIEEVKFGGSTIKLNLMDCFADEYFNSTSEWIDLVGNLAEEALGEESDDGSRNNLMAQLSEAAQLRKYAHLVHSISGEFGTVNDKVAISKALESLSRERVIREGFIKGFNKFLEATNYVIGIDSYKCPSCKNQSSKEYIIPIDVLQVFSTILGTRILRF